MLILEEQAATPEALAQAWEGDRSFLLVPTPCPVEAIWLDCVLGKLPVTLRQEHFGILTSGSTGAPKLVIGNKERTAKLAREIHRAQALESVTTAVLALPLAYSYSLVNQWLWAHLYGRELLSTRGLGDPAGLYAALQGSRDAMLCLVGSQVPLFRRHLPTGMQFPGIIRLNFAGSPFPQAELPWLREVFPQAEIYHNYGCTEALPRLTVRRGDESPDPMVLGEPLAGIELALGEGGELRFRSPYSAVAIAGEDGLNLIAANEWLGTGDLAVCLEDGRVRLIGRASQVFKRHGEKISLSAVTSQLREHWSGGIALYTETSPDGEMGYVVALTPEPASAELRKILLGFRERYRRPYWPIRIEAVENIPLSANGKPNLNALRESGGKVIWKQML
jgi:acyl-coenzyme A synthetase/AMP-(fatty) acid ligase